MAAEVEAQRGRPYPPPAGREPLWPALVCVLAAIALQVSLPERLAVGPTWLLPALEGALLIGLAASSPMRIEGEHALRRLAGRGLTALVSAANIVSLYLLAHELLNRQLMVRNPKGGGTSLGHQLILSGVVIWLTNVLIFALWYWETDRGGPGKRAAGHDEAPDFLFPQMTDDRIEPIDWRPGFIDYLYVSLTNAAAFSPTDTMPLTPISKVIMGTQSLVSLVTLGLIVSRAVNILA